MHGRLRLIVLAADDGYVRYIEQSGRSVLPLKAGETATISPSSLGRLADTPRQKAGSHGPWRDLRTTLRWTSTIRGCSLLAWEVTPTTGPSQQATYRQGQNRLICGQAEDHRTPASAQSLAICADLPLGLTHPASQFRLDVQSADGSSVSVVVISVIAASTPSPRPVGTA